MNKFGDMNTFVQVVKTGSFTKAGKRLGRSKSVIAKRINQLEDRLGVQLLRRSTRKLSVTDVGVDFYEQCITILSTVEDAESQTKIMNRDVKGHLRVSSSSALSAMFLAKELCEFQQIHLGLSVELIHNDRVVNPIHENFDICFQALELEAKMVIRKKISPMRRILCAAPDYLSKFGHPQHPDELPHHHCAHNIYIEPKLEWRFKKETTTITIPIEPIIKTNNIWMMLDAACNGNCISPLPVFVAEASLANGQLIPILTEYELPEFMFCAYYPRSPHVPVKTRLFLDFIVERYSGILPWEKRLADILV